MKSLPQPTPIIKFPPPRPFTPPRSIQISHPHSSTRPPQSPPPTPSSLPKPDTPRSQSHKPPHPHDLQRPNPTDTPGQPILSAATPTRSVAEALAARFARFLSRSSPLPAARGVGCGLLGVDALFWRWIGGRGLSEGIRGPRRRL